MVIDKKDITGIILAGGQARRMSGEDKGLINLNGRPMIEYAIELLAPQVGGLFINANRNLEDYRQYGFPIITDQMTGFCGPLAGMASALRLVKTEYMVTVPCDSPFLHANLVSRLATNLIENKAEISVAHNGKRLQPVFSLMKKNLHQSLQKYLISGERKIDRWYEQHRLAITDFSDVAETFDNFNTPEDIKDAEARLNSK